MTKGEKKDERLKAEGKYKALVETAADAIFTLDLLGRFTFANPAAESISGYSEEELLGKHFRELLPAKYIPGYLNVFQKALRGEPTPPLEIEMITKQGQRVPLELLGRPVRRGRRIVEIISIGRDITERKRAEEEVQKRLREITALHEVSEVVNSTLDLKEIFQRVVQELSNAFSYRLVDIYLLEEDGLGLQASVGYDDKTTIELIPLERGVIGRVARTGQPAFIHDVSQDSDYIPAYPDIASEICVPVKSGETLLGTLNVECDDERPLTDDDLQLLSTLSSHIGVAIENARLYEEEQERRQEAETLCQAAQALSATLDLQEVFESILSELQKVVPYDSASVQLLKGDRLEIIGGHGFPNLDELLGISFPVKGDTPNRQVVATRAPFIVEDAPAVYSTFHEEPHAQAGIRAWLGVPLLFGDRLIGMIALDKRVPAFYTEEHARLALAFAAQAAIAIENGHLYEEEQRRASQLKIIQEVGERIASILDLNQLLAQTVNLISDTFGYYYTHILLVDTERDEIVLKASASAAGKPLERWRAKISEESITGWVARNGEPLLVNDVSKEPRYQLVEELKDTKSELAVPIKIKDRVIGTLDVQSTKLNAFDESDLDTLQTLADQLAVAMENARLYEETKRLSITDGLTGLYNLRYFYGTLEKEIQRSERYHRSLSLTILDIDNFKAYNDLYGHLAGDDLLIELGQLMSKVTRQTDTLARYGGEEFAIILPETEISEARFLAERLQQEVREHRFSIQDGRAIGRITISLGVATYSHHADSAKALVAAADKALLRAKRAGKNRLFAFGEELIELEPR